MDYFVNLPLSWAYHEPVWLERLFERRLNPELGIDAVSIELAPDWHRETARRIADQGLRCSVHLPFFMPPPGSAIGGERARSVDILCRAAEIAEIYRAAHLIGHPAFRAAENSGAEARPESARYGFESRPGGEWLEHSATAWKKVLQTSNAKLFLENTHEDDPVPVICLLERLKAELAAQDAERTAMCFDAGHWHCFSNGLERDDLEPWIEYIAPHLGHLHLHDNDGSKDQHIGLGQGRIPLERLFALLEKHRLAPTFTLEPHDLESLAHSLAWLNGNASFKTWRQAAGQALPKPAFR